MLNCVLMLRRSSTRAVSDRWNDAAPHERVQIRVSKSNLKKVDASLYRTGLPVRKHRGSHCSLCEHRSTRTF